MRLSLCAVVVMAACGGSTAAIDAPAATATPLAACMHICMCEANAPGTPGETDASCQSDCEASNGPFSSSASSTSTSMSTSVGTSFSTTAGGVDFAASEQACVTCFVNASCSDIVAGTVCASSCN